MTSGLCEIECSHRQADCIFMLCCSMPPLQRVQRKNNSNEFDFRSSREALISIFGITFGRGRMSYFLRLSVALVLSALADSQYQPNWSSLDSRPLPQWYDDVKFGIFMHWGVYAVPSYGGGNGTTGQAEWFWWDWQGANATWATEFMQKNYPPEFTYADFAPSFKAELFNPDQWAQLFYDAGAKYVVLTSKHHEGWTNWPSKTAWNWNSVDNGPHTDLVGALAKSIRNLPNSPIHFGLYFSQFEWFNSLYLEDKMSGFTTNAYSEQVSQPQMYEIVNQYEPDVVWSDGDWEAPDSYWNSTGFLAWLYNESPVKDTVVVNDRWGSGCLCTHGGFHTCADDFNPHTLQSHKWENAMTVDKQSWGYRREATLSSIHNITELLEQLVTTVSCGGNLLLNVGPTSDGRIMPIFEERLIQMGTWLGINGEAIYGSRPWKHQNDTVNSNVWYTSNSTTGAVYGIVLQWPKGNTVTIGAVSTSAATTVTLLGYGLVKWTTVGSMLDVQLPYLPLDTPLQWAWTLKFEGVNPN